VDPDQSPIPGSEAEEETARRVSGWLLADDSVPPSAITAAKAGFSWRSTDESLAELTYDSSDDLLGLTNVRGSSTRQLCFAAGAGSVEIELRDESDLLVGQVIPTGPDEIELISVARPTAPRRAPADELGRFAIGSLPAGPIRLRWTEGSGRRVATDWFRA